MAKSTKSVQGDLTQIEDQDDLRDQNPAKDSGAQSSASSEEEKAEKALDKINHSEYTSYPEITGKKMLVLKNTICKDFTAHEMYFFLNVAHAAGLNPFLKEIWGWKDKYGKIVSTTGIAGYRSNASKHQDFKGVDSAVIYEGDDFEIDFVTKKIHHQSKGIFGTNKNIVGAWAMCKRDGFDPSLSVVRFAEYNKPDSSAWKNNPSKMILKVAEGEAIAKLYPINGVTPEWETQTTNGITDYVNHSKAEESEQELKQEELKNKIHEALEVIENYDGDDKERIADTIRVLIKEKTITVERLDEYIDHMKNN